MFTQINLIYTQVTVHMTVYYIISFTNFLQLLHQILPSMLLQFLVPNLIDFILAMYLTLKII